DVAGRFTLRAPGAGSYRLRAERIGFRVTESPALALTAGETRSYRMEGTARAVTLEPVTAGARRRCEVRPEEGTATAAVWNEARKALEAAELGARRYDFRVRLFRRTLALPGLAVRDSTSSSGFIHRPFATEVERLVAHGYVEYEADSIVYRAPDARTLLSDAFLDHHCFSLREGQGETAGLVGLVFAPLRGRRQPDVRGTLWLDRQTGHLRHVEYTYTQLPFARGHGEIGGRLEFARLADGGWIVNRWAIRMPVLVRRDERMDPVVTALIESGGEVLDIRPVPGAANRPRPAP
ncbi:MAG: carboxypeptidase-like regulatory domain-containing protein, partial [Gemmatimonadetes bacterium]|nr:carboxypeptidase-like regulatory domain-containing protein [Gemmatimonadota bacterium]